MEKVLPRFSVFFKDFFENNPSIKLILKCHQLLSESFKVKNASTSEVADNG